MKGKGRKPKKPEYLKVEKEFFLKAMEMLQRHEEVLQKMYAARQDNLGFEIGYMDESDLDVAARYVRTQTFMRQMKELLKIHHISRLAGAFDLAHYHGQEKEPIKKVVEGGS